MSDEQNTGESKAPAPVVISKELVNLKINTEVAKKKISLVELENRALKLVKNEDHLIEMKQLLKELDAVDDLAEEQHKKIKKPYLDGSRACDAGKKLVLDITSKIRDSFKGDYDQLLDGIAVRARLAAEKQVQDEAIVRGIENNVIMFSNMVVAAVYRKDLLAVEGRINLEKSPSMQKKYGEFHAQAIARYDAVLIPIIKDQKTKVESLEKLNEELTAAEANNDPDKMDELIKKVDVVSNSILQNHALVQEAALNQESFPVMEALEVLPGFKVTRTNYSIEIADIAVALKKAPELLDITVNKERAKMVLDSLKKDGSFHGKDEIILNGIKYIATKVREAL